MKQSHRSPSTPRLPFGKVGVAIGSLLVLGCLFVSPALASFEQVGNFGAGELRGARALAVNEQGTGGVAPGTVYAVSRNLSSGLQIYNSHGQHLENKGGFNADGVAIDQRTGDIYVFLNQESGDKIQVYSPDGSALIASFGETAANTYLETFDESPSKIHYSPYQGAIAVNESGDVYVPDYAGGSGLSESRVMEFEPETPGNYEHYVYAGRAHDIAVGDYPQLPAVDPEGNVYLSSSGSEILEFAPSSPQSPICHLRVSGGGIQALTVNPTDNQVFYFSQKNKKLHALDPSCGANGEFEEAGTIEATPKTEQMEALAVNPSLSFAPGRPAGVIYGAEPEAGDGEGYIFAPAEERPPIVRNESVSAVTSTSANLSAELNPNGFNTSYVFQYIDEQAYEANESSDRFAGAAEAPLGGSSLNGGTELVSVSLLISELQTETEYRYRILATSHCKPDEEEATCTTEGETARLRTFPLEAPGLPDSRAYELVSPVDKNGGEVLPAESNRASCPGVLPQCKPGEGSDRFPMQSAPEGEAIVYEGTPFLNTEGATHYDEYVSRRTSSGWRTTALSSPFQASAGAGIVAVNDELTEGVNYQLTPTLSADAPAEFPNLYVGMTATPSVLSPFLTTAPPHRRPATEGGGASEFAAVYAGSSADFSRQFFAANDALTGETPFAPPAVDGGFEKSNLYEWDGGELKLVNVLPDGETEAGAVFGSGLLLATRAGSGRADYSHAISDDGLRVFWSAADGQVYVREDGNFTREILDHAGKFLTASADGSSVLLDDGCLYDVETETCRDLTEDQNHVHRGGFLGISGQSEDLSSIYLVDEGALTSEAEINANGEHAVAGARNLYAWHDGSTRFIARFESGGSGLHEEAWAASPSARSAEASPDGRWLAFTSTRELTGQDNVGAHCERSPEGFKSAPCGEVFLYDSETGRLLCPSCNPSGQAPLGDSALTTLGADGNIPQPRYLTDSGRLYFDSGDSLSLFDVNDGVEDVYEYEPDLSGSCHRDEGCVVLISAGTGTVDSNFLAMDSTGKNVFFTTRDQLSLKDHDELIDLYDAREGGGIAAETETQRGECQGEACQSAVAPPLFSTPGSTTFSGAGNLISPLATLGKPKTTVLTRSQRLAGALKTCRRKPKKKRVACEKTARKHFVLARKEKPKHTTKKGGR
jgi:DNA-binding beta-propeller fold protein YncE